MSGEREHRPTRRSFAQWERAGSALQRDPASAPSFATGRKKIERQAQNEEVPDQEISHLSQGPLSDIARDPSHAPKLSLGTSGGQERMHTWQPEQLIMEAGRSPLDAPLLGKGNERDNAPADPIPVVRGMEDVPANNAVVFDSPYIEENANPRIEDISILRIRLEREFRASGWLRSDQVLGLVGEGSETAFMRVPKKLFEDKDAA